MPTTRQETINAVFDFSFAKKLPIFKTIKVIGTRMTQLPKTLLSRPPIRISDNARIMHR